MQGEVFDFHSLRHTCGAWLAMTGVHPKVVQTVMRHQSITLTMDTYGHRFPGQEADAVARLQELLYGPPGAMRATGTDHATADNADNDNAPASPLSRRELPAHMHTRARQDRAQRKAQQLARETSRDDAKLCDEKASGRDESSSHNPLRIADLGNGVRGDAKHHESSGGGTQTPDTLIRIQCPVPPT